MQGSPSNTGTLPTDRPRPNGFEHLAALFTERMALPDGDPRRRTLRDDLVGGYLPVAQHIVRKHHPRGENPDDVVQVARLGLVLAIDRFDPGRGVDFLSFAVPTINGEVQRYFRDRVSAIRVPRRLRQLQSMIYDAAAELGQRHGRAPRPSEIAAELGMDVELVLEGLQAAAVAHTASLDGPVYGEERSGDWTRFGEALGYLEPEFDLVEHRESLGPLLAVLPERERRILMMRFFGGLTQSEIGDRIGISQMHVSRLLSRTLTTLRQGLAAS